MASYTSDKFSVLSRWLEKSVKNEAIEFKLLSNEPEYNPEDYCSIAFMKEHMNSDFENCRLNIATTPDGTHPGLIEAMIIEEEDRLILKLWTRW